MFAVPEVQHKAGGGGTGTGDGGGLFGPCCGGDPDSDEEGGIHDDDSEGEDEYNCLGGGILAGCLPEVGREREGSSGVDDFAGDGT